MKQPIQKFVLFGATGDLAQRMIWPSLYHLCREKLVPPTFTFVGSARNPMSAGPACVPGDLRTNPKTTAAIPNGIERTPTRTNASPTRTPRRL